MRPNPGNQYRAARALLDWTQSELALAAGVPERAIEWLEHDNSRGADYAAAVVESLEANGVIFLVNEHDGPSPLTAVAIFESPPALKPAIRLEVECD